MKDPTIAKLTELLEQQLAFNQTLINASVPNVCFPAEALAARQTITGKGGFAAYVLDNSRDISEALDLIRSEQNGAGTA